MPFPLQSLSLSLVQRRALGQEALEDMAREQVEKGSVRISFSCVEDIHQEVLQCHKIGKKSFSIKIISEVAPYLSDHRQPH